MGPGQSHWVEATGDEEDSEKEGFLQFMESEAWHMLWALVSEPVETFNNAPPCTLQSPALRQHSVHSVDKWSLRPHSFSLEVLGASHSTGNLLQVTAGTGNLLQVTAGSGGSVDKKTQISLLYPCWLLVLELSVPNRMSLNRGARKHVHKGSGVTLSQNHNFTLGTVSRGEG